MTKKEYTNNNTIAYYSGFGGIEIKAIEYGIDDYVVFMASAWRSKHSMHKGKIYYNSSRPYFKYKDIRIHLDDCIKC